MNKIVLLFCEGKAGSLDYGILDKMASETTNKVQIVPVGGKYGLPAFMQGYLGKTVTPDFYLAFRDRDFDFEIPESQSLSSSNNKVFASYRITIENYLLNPTTFFNYLASKNLLETVNVSSIEESRIVFNEIAQNLKFYSAARHSLGKLRERLDFKTTWTEGSGYLPPLFDRNYCIEQSIALIEPVRVKTEQLTFDYFNTIYNSFVTRFNQDFIDNGDYLIWFNGKDLAKALQIKYNSISLKDYYKFSLSNFNFREFPDLVELFEKLNVE